jgi:multicomponent K+:H+ antiporter subunit D
VSSWIDHLVIAPVIVPLIAGAALLFIDERRHRIRAGISAAATFTILCVAILLMRMADAAPPAAPAQVWVYPLGSWPAPFGIVLALDRLSALMLVLTGILACASLIFSFARWDRAGVYFHALFQFLLMGLNGAFLTGDLFNLFVFFELLLAASYGLMLHGSGAVRVKAGLHYIVVNLAASMLFLIGVSLIYAVTGTLNMADLAARIAAVEPGNRVLLEIGAAVLAVAFLTKAAMWPLCFWLAPTYAAASPPVAAQFSIMTKVGVYVVLRLWLLLFGADAGPLAQFGGKCLVLGGLVTIAYGLIGVLASQAMSRLAGFALLVSSGTLLAAIGAGQIAATSGALFYLVSSVLAICAFFLLIELVERGREPGADVFAVTMEAFGDEDSLDQEEEIGVATPGTMAVLGLSFIACAVLISGLPPLSGFIAKFALLTAMLNPSGLGLGGAVSAQSWAFLILLIVSGLATMIAMIRAGIRVFWAPIERVIPQVRLTEIAPVVVLLMLCATLTVGAGPTMRYMDATAASLHNPQSYIRSILPSAEWSREHGG